MTEPRHDEPLSLPPAALGWAGATKPAQSA
jgi:hypothetical protein